MIHAAGLLYRLFGLHAAGLLFIQLVIMQLLRVQVAGYYAAGLLYRLFIIPLG